MTVGTSGVDAADRLDAVVRDIEETFADLRAQLVHERAVTAELLSALKLYRRRGRWRWH